MTVIIKEDVFPTTVTITDVGGEKHVLDRVRVIITAAEPNQILLFKDAANGPECVYSATALTYDAPRNAQRLRDAWLPAFTTYNVETPDGSINFTKNSGCGCGSRLKTFNPFPSIALAAS